MSGHSKWSTIKHKKAQKDQRRGVVFSKLSQEIVTAVREGGGGDLEKNPRLRSVLEKARAVNMPSDNISRAIDRGLGKGSGGAEEVIYEGYGPAGVAVVAIARTDNRQRTSADMRLFFERSGGSLGGPGSASYLFERRDGKFSAKVSIPVHEQETREKMTAFLEKLRLHEDITAVYSNAQLSDD